MPLAFVMLLVRRHEHVPEAFFLRQLFEVVDDLRRDPAVAARMLALEGFDVRIDVPVHECRNAGNPFLAFGAVLEIHGGSIFPGRAVQCCGLNAGPCPSGTQPRGFHLVVGIG